MDPSRADGRSYVPGFYAALRLVIAEGRAFRNMGFLKKPENLMTVGHKQFLEKEYYKQPEMCDKYLLLDMREPFVEDRVSEGGEEDYERSE